MLSRSVLVISGTVLVAALAAAFVGAKPGTAAFPGGNGRIAYTCRPDGIEVCVINHDGSGLGYLTQYDRQGQNFDERYPAWSPDGRRIAFVVTGFCTNEIYVMNADRTGLRRVLRERGESDGMWGIRELSWAPDGQRLVFAKSFHPGRCPRGLLPAELKQIFTIGVDGTGQQRITRGDASGWDIDPAWSPDGAHVAFVRELTPVLDNGLYLMSPDGSTRRRLDSGATGSPAWSPDGRSIAYDCAPNICVYSLGGGVRKLGPGSTPAWSPDGTRIVFAVEPGVNQADVNGGIFVMAADGSGRREIVSETGYASDGMGHPDWQPCRGSCSPAPGMPTFVKRPVPPPTLNASVGRGFTIALRDKAGRRVRTLVEGTYVVRMTDFSREHSFHVVGEGGERQPGTTLPGIARGLAQSWVLKPGRYRFFCDAHPRRMHGGFRVVRDPLGPYRP